MVSTVSPGFTATAIRNGTPIPNELPSISDDETIRIAFALTPMIGTDTVASVAWSSEPSGLTFANSARSNSNRNVEADVSGQSGMFDIVAICTLTAGAVRQVRARLAVNHPACASDYA